MSYLTEEFFKTCVLSLAESLVFIDNDFTYFVGFIHRCLKIHPEYIDTVFGKEILIRRIYSIIRKFLAAEDSNKNILLFNRLKDILRMCNEVEETVKIEDIEEFDDSDDYDCLESDKGEFCRL